VVVVGVALLEVEAARHAVALELQHADPMDLGIARLVVLLHAGVDATPTSDAAPDVEAVAEEDPVDGSGGADRHLLAVLGGVALLETTQQIVDLLLRELAEVLLEERLEVEGLYLLRCRRQRTDARGRRLEEFPARRAALPQLPIGAFVTHGYPPGFAACGEA
jgi:hypothetical protein